jgi:tritrans,polycis-undecaprenyl-diphosphate synthase [geranylgeranyl-diphosphate specific]
MHIAIIADGNRRWARKRNKNPSEGHEAGMRNAEKLIRKAKDLGIKYMTFYFFSTENLKKRPREEKKFLIDRITTEIRKIAESDDITKNQVRIRVFGRKGMLPKKTQESIAYAEKKTGKFSKYFLNLCIVYDGRDEIVDAVKEIMRKEVKNIDRSTIKKHLYTRDIPPPDMIIRTGMKKEKRLSAFLLWDSAYSEFYFTPTLFPAFKPRHLERAINDLKSRERRYGR